MSFFGMGRPQPSSEEKIGMMENEIIAMSDLHNRFVLTPTSSSHLLGNAKKERVG